MSKSSKQFQKQNITKIASMLALTALAIGLPFFILSSQKNTTNIEQAAGNALYVSPSGSDSNDGSQAKPLATLNKADSMASAGTTVHVLPGTYNGAVSLSKSGTATAPITFISDTKWGAKIIGTGRVAFKGSGDYVKIIGFDITSPDSPDGFDFTGSHNLAQGNHVHDLTGMACSGSPGGGGMGDDPPGSNNTFDGNTINNIGSYPTACQYVHGIYVDDPGDIIENNISYNNAGTGIYTNHGSGALNMTFQNNLSFANGNYGIGINGSGSTVTVQNNIVIGNAIAGMKTWSGVSNVKYINNILFNNPQTFIQDGGGTDQGSLTSDPQLVNYQANGKGDYHLKAGSPAIDAGVSSANAPKTDFDGKPRPQGKAIDIGPFEFAGASGGTSPAPTSSAPTPSTIVPSFVCGGSQNCAGTPSPTIFNGGGGGSGGGTLPSGTLSITPNPSSFTPSIPATSVIPSAPDTNISGSIPPPSGGDQQTIINLLLKLLEAILQLFGNFGGSHHSHSHGHHRGGFGGGFPFFGGFGGMF